MPLTFTPGTSLIPATTPNGHPIKRPTPVFSAISEEQVALFRSKFGGVNEAAVAGAATGADATTAVVSSVTTTTTTTTTTTVEKKVKSAAKPKEVKVDLSNLPPFARVDLRVGIIRKVWPHPEADQLWCEEVDVGESTPRLIASGLRAFYTADEMLGRRICVVCNLKPRTMRGFASAGMVLCAANADRSVVEFIDPPAEANIGERLTCEGIVPVEAPFPVPEIINPAKEGNPWTEVSGQLRTDANRIATFNGVPITVRGFACKAPTQVTATVS